MGGRATIKGSLSDVRPYINVLWKTLSLLIVDDIECSFRDWILPIPVKSDFLKVFWPGPDMLMVDQGPS